MRQDRRCARALANTVTGLLCGLPQHLRAEVLLRVLEGKLAMVSPSLHTSGLAAHLAAALKRRADVERASARQVC